MSIELAATEDATKTLCEKESWEQENTSMKEKAIPVFNKNFCRKCVILKKHFKNK